jgi:DNA-binding transcriptional ArsR family regulator
LTSQPSEGDGLHAVGHPYRVEIMRRFLATGTATPSDIARALRLPLTTVSYHVRFLADRGIVRLAGKTQRRGAVAHHYQLTDRDRVASLVWGTRAELLVTDFERQNGRGDVTVTLDPKALAELRAVTAAYLARIGELGLQTRERCGGDATDDAHGPELTKVAVLLATDEGGESVRRART